MASPNKDVVGYYTQMEGYSPPEADQPSQNRYWLMQRTKSGDVRVGILWTKELSDAIVILLNKEVNDFVTDVKTSGRKSDD